MAIDIRTQLYTALSESNLYAEVLKNPDTTIDVIPTTFLHNHHIYKIQSNQPPLLLYVGKATDNDEIYLLPNQSARFAALISADHTTITNEDTAIALVTTFLETTRYTMRELLYPISHVEQARFFPKLRPHWEQRQREFIQTYQSIIQPPNAQPTDTGFTVTVYVIRQQDLEHHTFLVTNQGDLTQNIEVLEQDLPLVFSHPY